MIVYILGFLWLFFIVILIRIVRGGNKDLEDRMDIPGSDIDINYSERPYIDRYI